MIIPARKWFPVAILATYLVFFMIINSKQWKTEQNSRDELIKEEKSSGSAISDSQTIEKQIIFPRRNVKELHFRLEHFRSLVRLQLRHLDVSALDEPFKDLDLTKTSGPFHVHLESSKGFIKTFQSHLSSVNFINITRQDLVHLPTGSYHYTSNNCTRYAQSPFSGANWYKLYCLRYQDTLFPTTFHESIFRLGLPKGFSYKHGNNITVSFLTVVRDAIISSNGDVFFKDMKLIPQGCPRYRDEYGLFYDTRKSLRHKAHKVFTVTQLFGKSYYHSVIEELARIAPYLDFLRRRKDILVHSRIITRKFLELLGIESQRLISHTYRANFLYVAAGQKCAKPSLFNIHMLSMELRLAINVPPQKRNSIVITKRMDTHRKFDNHQTIVRAISDAVKGTDIRVEVFDDSLLPSLQETMALFNRAFVVVGRHGAGLSNMIFSEPGTILIEGNCGMRPFVNIELVYQNLMSVLGHRYYGLLPKHNCSHPTMAEITEPLKYYLKELYLKQDLVQ